MSVPAPVRHFLKGQRGQRGATAVEFSLVAPVFLLFVLGVMDFGRLFWAKNLMQYGADKTARYAMVNPTITAASLEDYASTEIGTMLDGITFSAAEESVSGVGYRTISASYTFKFLTPLPLSDMELTAKARTPVNSS